MVAGMGIFSRWRRTSQTPQTGHALDDLTLQHIAQRSDITQPRHVLAYFICADQTAAKDAVAIAVPNGWDVVRGSQGEGEVLVTFERKNVVLTAKEVRSMRAFFDGLAQQVPGGDFDGWEASI